ncbi:hypothetical protein K435DRAFT_802818 [Dendrothele bispora CBS 962.96]|uniref:Uncharacterized protein n=1 Tax=Dendrothele bispora (strain CBS 962.96) TaxID=1314807 RepID=A0A4S8LJK2_DENBC|nr:hypothetical protein K435DRAFT_802818 [Dendrothele bispora CBS 962.96]
MIMLQQGQVRPTSATGFVLSNLAPQTNLGGINGIGKLHSKYRNSHKMIRIEASRTPTQKAYDPCKVSVYPSYHHDINTTAATATAFERLFLLHNDPHKLYNTHDHALPRPPGLHPRSTLANAPHDCVIHQYFNFHDTAYNQNPNGSFFVWLPQDEYPGDTFFDQFNRSYTWNSKISTGRDLPLLSFPPKYTYVNQSFALDKGLVYVHDGTVFMKRDYTTWLADGELRNSSHYLLRVSLFKQRLGSSVLFQTDSSFSISTVRLEDVRSDQLGGLLAEVNGVLLWRSRNGVGLRPEKTSNVQGGGLFAIEWDENRIAVGSLFHAAVPADIVRGSPNPSQWGSLVAALEHGDITFGGDWPGNSYATSGCPGTSADRLKDLSNFENASWSINYLKVYKKQLIFAIVGDSSSALAPRNPMFTTAGRMTVVVVVSFVL